MSIDQDYKIVDDEKADNFLEIMSDIYSRRIIEATMNTPKSALEIAKDTETPISTVYRRIQTLHDNKLLRTTGNISQEGKKFFLYQTKIAAIHTSYENGRVKVMIAPNKNCHTTPL